MNRLTGHDERVLDACKKSMKGEKLSQTEKQMIINEAERIAKDPVAMSKIKIIFNE